MSDNEDAGLIETLRNGYEQATQALEKAEHERDRLKKLVDIYEAGRDDSERVEGVVRSPGQLWARLLDTPMPERIFLLETILQNGEGARQCIVQGHPARIQDLTSRIEEAQRHLSETLGFSEAQPLYSLLVAVRALKNVMVEGIAARELVRDAVEEVELPEFVGDRDVREKIDEQLKSAGIDTQSICGFEWHTTLEVPDTSICTDHYCGEVNPLHTQDHICAGCGVVLTHVEAEKLAEAGR
jgi:hypothetical protein